MLARQVARGGIAPATSAAPTLAHPAARPRATPQPTTTTTPTTTTLAQGRRRRCCALLPPPRARPPRNAPGSSSPSPAAAPPAATAAPAGGGVLARWLFDCRYGTRTEATALLQEWVATVGARAGCAASNTRLSAGAVGVPESRLELELALPSLAAWEEFLARIDRREHRAWSERAARLMVDGSTRWEVLRAVPLTVAGGGGRQQDGVGAGVGSAAAGTAAAAFSPAAMAPAAPATTSGLVFSTPGSTIEAAAAEARGGGASSLAPPPPAPPRDAFADALMTALGAGRAAAAAAPSPPPAAKDADAAASDDGDDDGGGGASGGGGGGASSPPPLLDWKGEPMSINPGDKLPFKFL